MASLLGAVVSVPPAPTAEAGPPKQQVAVSPAVMRPQTLPAMPVFEGQPVAWPSAGAATVDLLLSEDRSHRLPGEAKPGGLPVVVTAVDDDVTDVPSGRSRADAADASELPARVRVEVLDPKEAQRAGVALALKVGRADGVPRGRVELTVDYSAFAHTYGGDWAWRLRLATMPACVLTTPEVRQCGQVTWLDSVNDGNAGVITAAVDVVATRESGARRTNSVPGQEAPLVVLTATGSSTETGDFTRTDVKDPSTWAFSGDSGDFSYSYPLEMPPVPGGLVPQVVLGYSSGTVNGQTAGTNTQPSVFGEGWYYSPGFIERTYRPCADDSESALSPYWTSLGLTADLCWQQPNAKLLLNGRSSEIVLAGDGTWRLANDDGSKVELLTGAPNGDNNGEHWKITTPDGTEYWFGRQTLPNGRGNTNSTPVVPVFANHPTEPCFSSVSASASRCQQAWRWMLDYVVDRDGNEISYWYDRATVRTGLMNSATATAAYHREVYLNRIEYGTHRSDASTVPAPARVVFTNSGRCVTTSCGARNEANWPDTPWDLECLSAPCGNNLTPSFWSSKRVSKISTEVLTSGSYQVVDEWQIGQSFPSASSPGLWLSSIERTGRAGGTPITLSKLLTHGTRPPNRADRDPGAGIRSHEKYRITMVRTETGGEIVVTYAPTDSGCVFGSTFPKPDNTFRRCFPRYYAHPTDGAGWYWWHKRIVSKAVDRRTVTTGTRTLSTAWAVPNVPRSHITRTGAQMRWEWGDGAWSLRSRVNPTHDSVFGRVESVSDEGGPATDDGTCTTYADADNASGHRYSFVKQQTVRAEGCAESRGALLDDTRYFYDGLAHGAAPGRGNVTRTETHVDGNWQVAAQDVVYDQHGRVTSTSDALNRTTTIAHTENTDRLTSQVTVTNPAGQVTTTSLAVSRGLPVTGTDPTGEVTTGSYDALRRLPSTTRPGNTTGIPGVEYAYTLSESVPSSVRTRVLGPNGTQITSYDIYDGRLRHRPTQATAADGNTWSYTHDDLDRRIEVREDSATGPPRAAWTYDSIAEGLLTSSTRYDGGAAYTRSVGSSADAYRPRSTRVTIPATTSPTRTTACPTAPSSARSASGYVSPRTTAPADAVRSSPRWTRRIRPPPVPGTTGTPPSTSTWTTV